MANRDRGDLTDNLMADRIARRAQYDDAFIYVRARLDERLDRLEESVAELIPV